MILRLTLLSPDTHRRAFTHRCAPVSLFRYAAKHASNLLERVGT
jgi:hypothetical protein